MFRQSTLVILFLLLLCTGMARAQCPINVGFDLGDFTNWEGYTGTITVAGGIQTPVQGIVSGIHTVITRASQQTDPYAGFALASPNGSSTIAKLGDNSTGKNLNKAQKLSYTFTVPVGQNEFSLIYYYAVVSEDPPNDVSHTDATKPKFTAAVYDVSSSSYTNCGNFNFVSIRNLPGFQLAAVQTPARDVYYKDWSPVTIDLSGYAGKTLRLEFTTNNCVPGGHFAYAYIDVNQNCASPISGNVICDVTKPITLVAPAGFAEYHWYLTNDPNKTELSNSSSYTISPAPLVGTLYSVRIVPYPNLGCEDIVNTVIKSSQNLVFNVTPTLQACKNPGADITAAAITAGTDPDFTTFNYYTDAQVTTPVVDPTAIIDPGTYYIEAIAATSGCNYIKPIQVSFKQAPKLVINNPATICAPGTIDITAAAVTDGSTFTDKKEYFSDVAATSAVKDPAHVAVSGTYYVKATDNTTGCTDIEPVTVSITDVPTLVTHDTEGCNTADITAASVTAGSTGGGTFTYWTDAAATIPLDNPTAITTTATYYIKVTATPSCPVIQPVKITVNKYPDLVITDPAAVVFPTPVDLSLTFPHTVGTSYNYYKDAQTTKATDKNVTRAGTYYIKANNGICDVTKPVNVTVNAPPDVNYSVNTFTPNGDGTNDVYRIVVPTSVKVNHFRIYGSWGALLFDTTDSNTGWDGTFNGKKMPVGTYYWIFDGYDTYTNLPVKKSGSITLIL